MSCPEYWKKSERGYFFSILDIPDSYKNFEKIVSYNESERSTKIMECCKCISMKKAGRRSSMKSYFHGFGGLLKADNDNWLPKQFKYRKGADK